LFTLKHPCYTACILEGWSNHLVPCRLLSGQIKE